MSTNSLPVRTEQSLKVATFLGGLTLSALTFLFGLEISYPPITFLGMTISYKELLILIFGVAAALLITSVFGLKTVLVHRLDEHNFFARFVLDSYEAGYFAILLVLPLLVLPFSMFSAVAIFILEGSWFTIWVQMDLGGGRISRRVNKRWIKTVSWLP